MSGLIDFAVEVRQAVSLISLKHKADTLSVIAVCLALIDEMIEMQSEHRMRLLLEVREQIDGLIAAAQGLN